MIQGTFTLSIEQEGTLANLRLKVQGDNKEFMDWLDRAYSVQSRMSPLSISTGFGETETFIIIRTP